MSPNPEKIDDRDDGLLIWRFTVEHGTVDVQADTKAKAVAAFAVWQATQMSEVV